MKCPVVLMDVVVRLANVNDLFTYIYALFHKKIQHFLQDEQL